jgi:hypothetical protein
LNSGRYAIKLRIGLHWVRWIVRSDEVLQFDVIADHGDSLFLNDRARPGVVSPLLDWGSVEPVSDANEAEPRTSAVGAVP